MTKQNTQKITHYVSALLLMGVITSNASTAMENLNNLNDQNSVFQFKEHLDKDLFPAALNPQMISDLKTNNFLDYRGRYFTGNSKEIQANTAGDWNILSHGLSAYLSNVTREGSFLFATYNFKTVAGYFNFFSEPLKFTLIHDDQTTHDFFADFEQVQSITAPAPVELLDFEVIPSLSNKPLLALEQLQLYYKLGPVVGKKDLNTSRLLEIKSNCLHAIQKNLDDPDIFFSRDLTAMITCKNNQITLTFGGNVRRNKRSRSLGLSS